MGTIPARASPCIQRRFSSRESCNSLIESDGLPLWHAYRRRGRAGSDIGTSGRTSRDDALFANTRGRDR